MKLSIISFTEQGRGLSERIRAKLPQQMEAILYTKSEKVGTPLEKREIQLCKETLTAWTEKQFEEQNAILFIGACGIAVRAIAPFVRDKLTDVPVLVADEKGSYIIPVLSGHYGRANELAAVIGAGIGAQPVLTTATDVNEKFAVDVFAKQNNLCLYPREGIRRISAAILAGERVTLSVDGEMKGSIPEELTLLGPEEKEPADVRISVFPPASFEKGTPPVLWLCPQAMVLGIGCKKGKTLQELMEAVQKQLNQYSLPLESVVCLASIDRKKEEEGLCRLAEEWKLPFVTLSEKELWSVQGEYTASDFVRRQVGVDNVCERAAMAAAGAGAQLIMKKKAENGITIAAAVRKWSVYFEEASDCNYWNGTGERGDDEQRGCSGIGGK